MRRFLVGLITLSVTSLCSAAPTLAPNTWTNVAATADSTTTTACWDTGTCNGNSSGVPHSRKWFPMVFDASIGKVLVIGGGIGGSGCDGCTFDGNRGCYINDVWEYDFSANIWNQKRHFTDYEFDQDPDVWPPGFDNHSATYGGGGKTWILGGTCNSSGAAFGYYDSAANTFTQVDVSGEHGEGYGSPFLDPGLAYGDGKVVAFSGEPGDSSSVGLRTSTYDVTGSSWTHLTYPTDDTPPPRQQIENQLVYDSYHNVFVLFGGQGKDPVGGDYDYEHYLNDTWEFDVATQTWTEITPVRSPSIRMQTAMVYDSKHHVVIMYGGNPDGGGTPLNDTWVYDAGTNTWRQIYGGASAPARRLHGMAYDSTNDVVIMFGGTDQGDGDDAPTDVWAFRYVAPPTVPTLQDEKDTYTAWGWSWGSATQPTGTGCSTSAIETPDIHGDVEGDDLWNNLVMYERTGVATYSTRASNWATFFKSTSLYNPGTWPIPDTCSVAYCDDRNGSYNDHVVGIGLASKAAYDADSAALTALTRNTDDIYSRFHPSGTHYNSGYAPGTIGISATGVGGTLRMAARNLLAATWGYAMTGNANAGAVRDRLIRVILLSPDWDEDHFRTCSITTSKLCIAAKSSPDPEECDLEDDGTCTGTGPSFTGGMWFEDESMTDDHGGTGAYDDGIRIQSAWTITAMAEALYQTYLQLSDTQAQWCAAGSECSTTDKAEISRRIGKIADFVTAYGLDSTYQLTASRFGVDTDTDNPWHEYAEHNFPGDTAYPAGGQVCATNPNCVSCEEHTDTFWDPSNTTAMVNTFMVAYLLTDTSAYYDSAKTYFGRGMRGFYGGAICRTANDTTVHHFVDATCDTSASIYFANNKGELQYTSRIFSSDEPAPAASGATTLSGVTIRGVTVH